MKLSGEKNTPLKTNLFFRIESLDAGSNSATFFITSRIESKHSLLVMDSFLDRKAVL